MANLSSFSFLTDVINFSIFCLFCKVMEMPLFLLQLVLEQKEMLKLYLLQFTTIEVYPAITTTASENPRHVKRGDCFSLECIWRNHSLSDKLGSVNSNKELERRRKLRYDSFSGIWRGGFLQCYAHVSLRTQLYYTFKVLLFFCLLRFPFRMYFGFQTQLKA